MKSSLSLRSARPDDLDRLVAIHTAAFPNPRSAAVRRRNFEHNALGELGDLRVLMEDGAIVGHAFSFRLGVFFGGVRVPASGIASVGIAPEARGRGLGAELLSRIDEESRARGDAIALLYPFRQAFYRALGYAPVTPRVRLEASPRAVPATWIDAARRARLEAGGPENAGACEAAYGRYAARSTGLLDRPERLWERRKLDERRHVVVLRGDAGGDPVRGYVAFSHVQSEAHADVTLVVEELVADDDEARRVLLGAIGLQRAQVRSIVWQVAHDEPFAIALEDPDRDHGGTEELEHELGKLATGPMVKLLDPERALVARGYREDGAFAVRVGGEPPRTVVVEHGRATIAREPQEAPLMTLDAITLASVLYGGVRVRHAHRLGALAVERDGDLDALDRLLALPAFEVLDDF